MTSESGSAKLAAATTDAGINRHALPRLQPRDVGSYLSNDSSGIAAHNFRQGDFNSRHPPPEEDIDVVDRRGFNLDENFSRSSLWFGHVFVFEDLRTAMFFKNDCFHKRP